MSNTCTLYLAVQTTSGDLCSWLGEVALAYAEKFTCRRGTMTAERTLASENYRFDPDDGEV